MPRPQTATTSGVSASAWLPVDINSVGPLPSLEVEVTGSVTYSVEGTNSDLWTPGVTPVAFPCGVAALTAATTNQSAQAVQHFKFYRLNQTVGAGTAIFRLIEKGIL